MLFMIAVSGRLVMMKSSVNSKEYLQFVAHDNWEESRFHALCSNCGAFYPERRVVTVFPCFHLCFFPFFLMEKWSLELRFLSFMAFSIFSDSFAHQGKQWVMTFSFSLMIQSTQSGCYDSVTLLENQTLLGAARKRKKKAWTEHYNMNVLILSLRHPKLLHIIQLSIWQSISLRACSLSSSLGHVVEK